MARGSMVRPAAGSRAHRAKTTSPPRSGRRAPQTIRCRRCRCPPSPAAANIALTGEGLHAAYPPLRRRRVQALAEPVNPSTPRVLRVSVDPDLRVSRLERRQQLHARQREGKRASAEAAFSIPPFKASPVASLQKPTLSGVGASKVQAAFRSSLGRPSYPPQDRVNHRTPSRELGRCDGDAADLREHRGSTSGPPWEARDRAEHRRPPP